MDLRFLARETREDSFRRLDQYLDAGGNFLDTANMYSHWINDTTKGGEAYCCVQQRYSYLRPKAGWDFGQQIAANDDLLEYVKDTGITLLAYSPLLYGAYTDRTKTVMEQYVGPDTDARLKVLDEVASESGATRNQVVYSWLMNGNPAAIPLVASTTDAQFEEALGSLHINLSKTQMNRLTEAKA